jgi:hypothetical protein
MLDRILAIGMLVFIGGAMWAWRTNPAYEHESFSGPKEALLGFLGYAGMLAVGGLVGNLTNSLLLGVGTIVALFVALWSLK